MSTIRNMLIGRRVSAKYVYRAAEILGIDVEALAPWIEVLPKPSRRSKTAS